MTDRYDCGCYWTRRDDEIVTGDVLVQCEKHRTGRGNPYPGSGPMSDDEVKALVSLLRDEGLDAKVLK